MEVLYWRVFHWYTGWWGLMSLLLTITLLPKGWFVRFVGAHPLVSWFVHVWVAAGFVKSGLPLEAVAVGYAWGWVPAGLTVMDGDAGHTISYRSWFGYWWEVHHMEVGVVLWVLQWTLVPKLFWSRFLSFDATLHGFRTVVGGRVASVAGLPFDGQDAFLIVVAPVVSLTPSLVFLLARASVGCFVRFSGRVR
jgi:hypothetical protein